VSNLEAGQWEEARSELLELTSVDSNYKDAATLLRESYYRPAMASLAACRRDVTWRQAGL
jgi:hypothetical protein